MISPQKNITFAATKVNETISQRSSPESAKRRRNSIKDENKFRAGLRATALNLIPHDIKSTNQHRSVKTYHPIGQRLGHTKSMRSGEHPLDQIMTQITQMRQENEELRNMFIQNNTRHNRSLSQTPKRSKSPSLKRSPSRSHKKSQSRKSPHSVVKSTGRLSQSVSRIAALQPKRATEASDSKSVLFAPGGHETSRSERCIRIDKDAKLGCISKKSLRSHDAYS